MSTTADAELAELRDDLAYECRRQRRLNAQLTDAIERAEARITAERAPEAKAQAAARASLERATYTLAGYSRRLADTLGTHATLDYFAAVQAAAQALGIGSGAIARAMTDHPATTEEK